MPGIGTSVLALLIAIARVVGDFIGTYQYDLGRHFSIVPESYWQPLTIVRTPYQANPDSS